MVDRAVFPRDKVCGDGLTPRAVKSLLEMGVDLRQPAFVPVAGARLYGMRGRPVDLRWRRPPGVAAVARRLELDRLLVAQAEGSGVRVLQGVVAQEPLVGDDGVGGAVVRMPDGATKAIQARHTVAADGAASRFGLRAGIRRVQAAPVAAAARGYFRSPHSRESLFEALFTLRRNGRALPGYGWIFPAGGDELNVGVFLIRAPGREPVSAAGALHDFVRSLPPRWEIEWSELQGDVRSAPIPMGLNRSPVSLPGLLVVGDAVGMVNPFTGEGISYALESGQMAAEAIATAAAGRGEAVPERYARMLRERYRGTFGGGRRFVRAIARPAVMSALSAYGMRATRMAAVALEAMADAEPGGVGGPFRPILRAAAWRAFPEPLIRP
jgi:geranylgeranyl reductase family protein